MQHMQSAYTQNYVLQVIFLQTFGLIEQAHHYHTIYQEALPCT